MKRIAALIFILAVAQVPGAADAKTFKSKLHSFKVEVVTDRLKSPWGFAFLPDGGMLITQKKGQLRHFKDGKLSAALPGTPQVRARGQGGLLDVALDPDFATNRQIYLTYSQPSAGGAGTAVARATFTGTALEDVRVIFSQRRKTPRSRHFGSRIAFAPDGTLFFTIGDRGEQRRAQDPQDHAGSVLRINTDGSVPADNPYADGKGGLPQIWSIGHRNPQGIDIHPDTGEVWTVAHGASGGDEVNRPEAGKNYGWPVISYGRHYSGQPIGEGTAKEGMEQPRYYWDPSIAPSSMTFYTGDQFPEWRGDMFVSALAGELLARLDMDGDEIVSEERLLEGEYGRLRRVKTGPDGALYVITDGGELLRISPAG